ncbi:hypothetical protein E8E14_010334 [Neopestalotiopsis sp. 37M]|nr:hypothetical protein E8E14_010334 [Neopestalotiopsis sp. 37M]
MKEQTAYGTSNGQQGGQKHCRQEDLKDSHDKFYATRMGRGRLETDVALPSSATNTGLLSPTPSAADCIPEPTLRDKALNWRCLLAGIFIGILLSLLPFSTVAFVQPKNKCTLKMNTWSPALEIFDDDDLKIQRFNGTLRVPHEFCAAPSDEIDEKWDKITFAKGGLMRLSEDDVHRNNVSEYAAEYTEEMGGGYMGAFEVFHGLHCLNMLRQASYIDHYLPKKKEWRDDPETLRFHLD